MEATFEESTDPTPAISEKRRFRAGVIVSALPVSFLIFDGAIKIVNIGPVVEALEHLGYPPALARGIGVLEFACLITYLVPRTSVLGAVLLTGFLGGAISSHARVGDPWFSHVLFPAYVALLLWGGLLLRKSDLRVLFGLSPKSSSVST